jgi:hypothetical protein
MNIESRTGRHAAPEAQARRAAARDRQNAIEAQAGRAIAHLSRNGRHALFEAQAQNAAARDRQTSIEAQGARAIAHSFRTVSAVLIALLLAGGSEAQARHHRHEVEHQERIVENKSAPVVPGFDTTVSPIFGFEYDPLPERSAVNQQIVETFIEIHWIHQLEDTAAEIEGGLYGGARLIDAHKEFPK